MLTLIRDNVKEKVYSWEMALIVGLELSFDKMKESKGTRGKAGEDNTKACITND
jgi:hypothetical protein